MHMIREAPFGTYLKEPLHAAAIADALHGELIGKSIKVNRVATFQSKLRNSICYVVGPSDFDDEIERVVICDKSNLHFVDATSKILVSDPRMAFIQLMRLLEIDWIRTVNEHFDELGYRRGKSQVHHSCIAENGILIGENVEIRPGVILKSGTVIGHDTYISDGAIVGTHGPAYYAKDGIKHSFRDIHFGTLHVGNSVEIGNGSILLKALLGRTHIGSDTILGNLVHIGHGCEVGKNAWMAARVTVCGHVKIDNNVELGAGATIRDNITIGNNAKVAMGSVVVNDVDNNQLVAGVPAKPRKLNSIGEK